MLQASDVNLWPPFSVTLTPINNTQSGATATNTNGSFATGMFPVYYIPAQQRSLQSDPPLTPGFQSNYYFLYL